ncbi:MAG TPA: PIN domain-containing protein [Gemmatimonadota bacterium]|nr:PIN domain-containing protein [Gemmatimonadota bacterium]
MDVVFLDANILFSAAYRPNAGLLRLWDLEEVEIVSSEYAVEEARRNLAEATQQKRLDRLLRLIRIVPETPSRENEIGGGTESLPSKDLPILLAAIAAHATHLLTGDLTHFGHLLGRRIRGLTILTPSQYLAARLGGSRPAE